MLSSTGDRGVIPPHPTGWMSQKSLQFVAFFHAEPHSFGIRVCCYYMKANFYSVGGIMLYVVLMRRLSDVTDQCCRVLEMLHRVNV